MHRVRACRRRGVQGRGRRAGVQACREAERWSGGRSLQVVHESDDHGGARRAERPLVPDRAVDDHQRDAHRVVPLLIPDLVEHCRRDRAGLPVLHVTPKLRDHRLQRGSAQLLRHAQAERVRTLARRHRATRDTLALALRHALEWR